MIDEGALWFKRGELVEFKLHVIGGPKNCRGLVLNTAVLWGRGARQLWILDIDDATPDQQAHWTNRKHIIHEEDIIAVIPRVVIGGDTILRDNPISYPVQDGARQCESPAIAVTIALPVPSATDSIKETS